MNSFTENVAERLNELIEKNIDATKGFSKAAENASSSELKNYFSTKSEERQNFVAQLETIVGRTGEEVEDSGSLTGTAHRTWMDVKSLFSSDNDEAMLEAAITGEKAAVDEYKEILDEPLPMEAKEVLQRQLSRIESGLNRIKVLEDLAD
ncbi:PA2169 family four-helix-bundle protein [Flagellimonas sp. 389]|uniref:ferritin-like domain-containing protein n=1 Tax=Flagellimonas sp. 389 TaxID=2835862 RepID=UPI001BD3479A|nr:PA2169 family four-helix-bundle protein [Flagellimonas sp. 389]MBS9464276.1 PA2169 family four-helix-bundle protein [Flagellimonas sp. 389]